jgi:DNA-binding beta-propeller fold protein YncE
MKRYTPIHVGLFPQAMTITPDTRPAYVVNVISATVTPVSTRTNRAGPPITRRAVLGCHRDHPRTAN